jgi:cell division protein FtsB
MRGRVLLGGVLLAGAAYFALFGGQYSLLELRQVRQERVLEEERLARDRAELETLIARRDSLATDSATLEQLARDDHGLIRDGERLYRFVDGDTIAVDSTGTPLAADTIAGQGRR